MGYGGRLDGDDILFSWRQQAYCVSPLPDGCPGPQPPEQSGTVRIDLATGAVTEETDPMLTGLRPAPRDEVPAAVAQALADVQLRPTFAGPKPPWRPMPDLYAVTELPSTTPVTAVLRRVRADGSELPTLDVAAPDSIFSVVASVDERHAAVGSVENPEGPLFHMSIVDLATGDPLGSVTVSNPLMALVVAQDTVVWGFQPTRPNLGGGLTVAGLGLGDQGMKWSEAARSMQYTGSFPP